MTANNEYNVSDKNPVAPWFIQRNSIFYLKLCYKVRSFITQMIEKKSNYLYKVLFFLFNFILI